MLCLLPVFAVFRRSIASLDRDKPACLPYTAAMKSPFTGMDPYLEARWGDVHQGLITYARDALQPQLPPDLRARVEERVFVEAEAEQIRRIVPDVHVAQYPPSHAAPSTLRETGGAAVAEPMVFLLEDEALTEGYIEIRERGGGKVITVIEFLSPANKIGGEGQKLYLQKQREVLHSDTNLVEIDLVRSGQRVIAFPEHRIPPTHRGDNLACVRCAWSERARELYVLPLRERLPVIPIPLRKSDRPVLLDLQALIDQCCQNGCHDDIDYTERPIPLSDGGKGVFGCGSAALCGIADFQSADRHQNIALYFLPFAKSSMQRAASAVQPV